MTRFFAQPNRSTRAIAWRVSLLTLIALCVVLFGATIQPTAQSAWTLWAFQPMSGQLQQIDSRGNVVATQTLSLAAGVTRLDDPIIDPTGRYMAFRTKRDGSWAQTVHIIALATMTEVATANASPLPDDDYRPDDHFMVNRAGFSPDGSVFVVTEHIGGVGWRLYLLDIAANTIMKTLSDDDPLLAPYPQLRRGVPIVQAVRGDAVTLTLQDSIARQHHTYTWYALGNFLAEVTAAPNFNGDALGRSLIHPVHDARFGAESAIVRRAYEQRNALHIYESLIGRYPTYADPSLDFERVQFIEGGNRVLATAIEDEIRAWWVVIDRIGGEILRLPIAGHDPRGTANGFVYATPVGGQTAIVQVDTVLAANAGQTLWIDDGEWRILWAQLVDETNNAAWTQLAAPLSDPSGVPSANATPTQHPPTPDFRFIGQAIQIYMPDDDYLNLRDAPTTNSNVLTLLESGTRGVITDGAIEADGFIWWEVQIGNRRGWVVESLPDNLVLIPPQDIPDPTPTPTAEN